jgi:hypothetical protein
VFKVPLRSPEARVRLKADEVWLRCGAGGYGREGTLVAPGPAAGAGGDDLGAAAARDMAYARRRSDTLRARQRLPPATDDEFLDAYEAELTALLHPPPGPRRRRTRPGAGRSCAGCSYCSRSSSGARVP